MTPEIKPPGTHIPLRDGSLYWCPGFLANVQAVQLFSRLMLAVEWKQEWLNIAGRSIAIPRLQAWYGDRGYRYSGLDLAPAVLPPELKQLAGDLGLHCGVRFNSVLLNLYRDGQDSVGWHSDDEPELGKNPCIASLSLGASRCFQMRHKEDASQRLSLNLTQGSLLVMRGSMQRYWRHQVAKTRKVVGPRINLTFREIIDVDELSGQGDF